MIPLSCSNCWFNGLQYGPLGLSAGYCAEHRAVLRQADYTTCPRHMRKDLDLATAVAANKTHRRYFSSDVVQLLRPNGRRHATEIQSDDIGMLRADAVGDAVANYGDLGSKIESLAQLSQTPGARSEIALLSLGRAYVRRCISLKGRWTSGLHLMWWTRKKLEQVPDVRITDFRHQTAAPLDRQAELAQWSIMMLRLSFVSDVGCHASSDPVAKLGGLLEAAAEATEIPSPHRLLRWTRSAGVRAFDQVLPAKRYKELARELHRDEP